MDTCALDSYLDTARRIDRLKDYPLDAREPSHVVYREKYAQNVASYAPLALSTVHPDFSGHYLVYDRPYKQEEDVLYFDRHYANIPARWHVPVTVGFDYPGYVGDLTSWGTTVSASVTAAANSDGTVTVTKNSHGLTTGDMVYLVLKATATGLSPRWFGWVRQISAHTSNTFTVPGTFFGSWTLTNVTYADPDGWPSRSIRSLTVSGLEVHEYALPGVTTGVTDADDFAALPELRFLDGAGAPVTTLNSLTEPTNTQWLTAAAAGERFVYSSLPDAYLGAILERVTVYLPFIF